MPDQSPSSRKDLRKHMRFQVEEATAKVYLKGLVTSIGAGRVNHGKAAINLSESGVLLTVGEAIPVGTKVSVRIELGKFPEAIEAEGVVRWCSDRATGTDEVYAGVEFSGLGEDVLQRIARMREKVGVRS
jgi:hypothetical protein